MHARPMLDNGEEEFPCDNCITLVELQCEYQGLEFLNELIVKMN